MRESIERINADPGRYLTRDGVGKGYVCPVCGSGAGPRGTGITSRDGKHFTCWAGRCFTSATVFDVLAVKMGIDPKSMSAADYAKVLREAGEEGGGNAVAPSQTPLKGQGPLKISSSPTGRGTLYENSTGVSKGNHSLWQGLGDRAPNVPPSSYLADCAARVDQTDYFRKRGISEDVIKAYGLGYDPQFKTRSGDGFETWAAAVIPTGGGAYVLRNTDSRGKDDRIRKRGEARLFNQRALTESNQPVFIVEGEFDALSILEAGGEAVGLGSVANVDKLTALLQEQAPTQPLILALDNDESGEKAQGALIDALDAMGIPFDQANVSGAFNDPNEALVAERLAFLNRVQKAAENAAQAAQERSRRRGAALAEAYVERYSALSHLSAFLSGVSDSADQPATPTGFAGLDRLLDGGLYEGLYILGAVSSLGKTTFVLQMCDQVASGGRDALIFTLEMSKYELIAKSLSRLSYQLAREKSDAKTARGITDGKRYSAYRDVEHRLIGDALQAYSGFASRIFLHEGMGDVSAPLIREAVQNHIRLTGKAPLVVVDYLQLLQPADPRMTDKQAVDKSVLELKRITRDFKLPLIAISSFNRENYKQTANMAAFKESGAIEYSSDVLIALQPRGVGESDFDADEARLKDPREVELVILKNRNGQSGVRIPFAYYPRFNIFLESPDQPRGARRV